MPHKPEHLRTIEHEARRIHMSRERLRRLCIAGGISVRWGGTEGE